MRNPGQTRGAESQCPPAVPGVPGCPGLYTKVHFQNAHPPRSAARTFAHVLRPLRSRPGTPGTPGTPCPIRVSASRACPGQPACPGQQSSDQVQPSPHRCCPKFRPRAARQCRRVETACDPDRLADHGPPSRAESRPKATAALHVLPSPTSARSVAMAGGAEPLSPRYLSGAGLLLDRTHARAVSGRIVAVTLTVTARLENRKPAQNGRLSG